MGSAESPVSSCFAYVEPVENDDLKATTGVYFSGLHSREGWRESEKLASQINEVEKSKKLLWARGHALLKEVRGLQVNEDVFWQGVKV